MKTLRISLVAIALTLSACADSTMEIDETGELDIERASDPEASAEAELRSSAKFDTEFRQAAKEFNVPMAALKSVAFVQSRYEMVQGHEEFEGRPASFGVMGLPSDQIEQVAAEIGASPEAIKTDALQNIRAAAFILSKSAHEQNIASTDVRDWAPAIASLSGVDAPEARVSFVRDEVFETMRLGVGEPTDELRAAGQSLELESDYAELTQELVAGPDYAKSVWRPSPNYSARSLKPSMVIIHTCEGSYSSCWGWLRNTAAGASAHYVVNNTGSEISQLVRESQRAWHVGATYYCSNNSGVACNLNGWNVNHFSVGIEHAGYASQSSFPAGQIDASARLTCDISKAHGIVRDRFHVVAHGKLQPYNRTDPGPNWPWSTYLSKVNSYCAPPAPAPAPTGGLVIDSNNGNNNRSKGYVKVSSNWKSSASTSGYYGTGYWFAETKPVSDGAEFWFYMPSAGTRTVDARWTAGTNRSPTAPFVFFNAAGAKVGSRTTNQQVNHNRWVSLGSYNFSAGWNKVVLSRWTTTGKVVIGDAVRIR